MSNSKPVDLTLIFIVGVIVVVFGLGCVAVGYTVEGFSGFLLIGFALSAIGGFVLQLWTIAVGVAWGIRSTR